MRRATRCTPGIGLALAAFAGLLAAPPASLGAAGEGAGDIGPFGYSGWAALLAGAGHEVERVQRPIAASELDPSATAILLGADEAADRDLDALGDFVTAGGRLIVDVELGSDAISTLTGVDLTRGPRPPPATLTPLAPAPELAGVGALSGSGEGSIGDPGATLPLLGVQGIYAAVRASRGEGTVLVVADPSPLRNGRLAEADNAAFALALAGDPERPVVFLEPGLAPAPGEGLGALPERWIAVGVGLALAALLLIAARARRLTPPREAAASALPPRSVYLDALAAGLARTADRARLAEVLGVEARQRLRDRAGLGPDPAPERLRAAAFAFGLDVEEADSLVGDDGLRPDPIVRARALAKLSKAGERRWAGA